jgi:hypothetical protein
VSDEGNTFLSPRTEQCRQQSFSETPMRGKWDAASACMSPPPPSPLSALGRKKHPATRGVQGRWLHPRATSTRACRGRSGRMERRRQRDAQHPWHTLHTGRALPPMSPADTQFAEAQEVAPLTPRATQVSPVSGCTYTLMRFAPLLAATTSAWARENARASQRGGLRTKCGLGGEGKIPAQSAPRAVTPAEVCDTGPRSTDRVQGTHTGVTLPPSRRSRIPSLDTRTHPRTHPPNHPPTHPPTHTHNTLPEGETAPMRCMYHPATSCAGNGGVRENGT